MGYHLVGCANLQVCCGKNAAPLPQAHHDEVRFLPPGDFQDLGSGVTEFHESLRMATKRAGGVSNEFMKPMECLCDRKFGELVRFRSFARLARMKEYKLR